MHILSSSPASQSHVAMEPDAESSSSSSDPVKEGEENKFAHKNSLSEREVMKRQRFLQNSRFVIQ